MGETKRKRGRKPKNLIPETLDLPTTTTSMDDEFSFSNVEIIDPSGSHPEHRLRRGRPKKIFKLSDKSEKSPIMPPTRLVTGAAENGDLTVPGDVFLGSGVAADPGAVWGGVSRVVPAMDAVVKVFCVHTEPNFSLPWQRKRQYSSSSSGFVISGRRVLTNAHSVEHYTQVKLKKRGSDTKYLATVLAIGTECDIGI